MLATRAFWFQPPVRYDPAWAKTLKTYRQHTEPWPSIPEPSTAYYIEHLLLTKDSAPGPHRLPYAFWRMFPQQTAAILHDDFDRMLSRMLPAPTQVGVWIPKAKQGPTADFFRPLGMPDTLDRLQDGMTAAILFRTTRHCFHLMPFVNHSAQYLRSNRRLREKSQHKAYLQISPKLLNESMHFGSYTSCTFANVPLGY